MPRSRTSNAEGLDADSPASLKTVVPGQTGQNPLNEPATRDGSGLRDFDFLVGEWQVHHSRLQERLAGSTAWVEFAGTCHSYPMMAGWGNVDDNVLSLPEGEYRAIAMRTFDGETGQWAIWWVDGRNPHGAVDPPVKGRFANGIGVFETDDTLGGQKIRIRFTWSRITPTTAHWEQAFSPDEGKTWETNWRMDFRRKQ